jgi:hypothetical protein
VLLLLLLLGYHHLECLHVLRLALVSLTLNYLQVLRLLDSGSDHSSVLSLLDSGAY